ncbi:MAG: SIS domain-containing protein [Nitrososphaerota archaeon]|jgi:arabinose-5-phosphate isomerase|nr:SIS domain-containing protein [Nitrososphaerota archaeon]MDG6930282.1 SIS domain-containing protein [Nitrososphaerota archaeon]MDG6932973.1 SIS domain-containing protein [Nitrososphaerota archaeon]MDG6935705.1 SIS domain-containing protein [Nitrososphaerota archaeon]MDG6943557.1 SIS domain-containing protein [Nitrososphaerota archaeon]
MQVQGLSSILTNGELASKVEQFIKLIKAINGFVFFTGIGKNMYVAARVADTYQSMGIRSLFVDPVNSLHGGMGIFTENDYLVAISKSGQTEELIRFIQALNAKNFRNILAVTSSGDSYLARASKLALIVPVEKEGDHLNMAPISSTMMYGALLDSIAVQVSSERGYSKADFVRNHPGGTLGKL